MDIRNVSIKNRKWRLNINTHRFLFPSLNHTIPELCEVNAKESVISSKHRDEYEQSLSVTELPIADTFVSLPQPSLLHHSAETTNKALRYTSQQMLLTMKFI